MLFKNRFPLLVSTIFGLAIMLIGYFAARLELKKEEKYLLELQVPANREFAVLTEFHPSKKKFTYQVPDEQGHVYEVTESVDEKSARRLRVGDTVPVYRKSGFLFSKNHLISRIADNQMYPGMLVILKNIFLYGSIFFIIQLTGILGIFILNKKV